MKHKMESTPRILTIIGLAFEGLSVIGIFVTLPLLRKVLDPAFLLEMDPTITQADLDFIEIFNGFILTFAIISGIIISIFFIINLILFTKLLRGKFTEETAKKVYLYQFIWGIVCIFINSIVGILYIISGYTGQQGPNTDQPREGI